jgi:putative oxidoreductase
MLASMFISGGVSAVRNPAPLAVRAAPVLDRIRPLTDRASQSLPFNPTPEMLVRANGLLNVAAGLTLATGRAPRLSSLVLAASLVPTTFGGHRYWEQSDPLLRANHKVHFLKNVSMAGGLLLASVDTEGRPSLAWRARRQARQAKKQAKSLARAHAR